MKASVIASCLVVSVLVASVHPARSQPVMAPPLSGSPHRILVSVALEPAVVLSLGYVYDLGDRDRAIGFSLGGGVKVPTTVLEHGAWRVHLITAAHWVLEARWGVTAMSEVYLARNHNRAGTMHGPGWSCAPRPAITARAGAWR